MTRYFRLIGTSKSDAYYDTLNTGECDGVRVPMIGDVIKEADCELRRRPDGVTGGGYWVGPFEFNGEEGFFLDAELVLCYVTA